MALALRSRSRAVDGTEKGVLMLRGADLFVAGRLLFGKSVLAPPRTFRPMNAFAIAVALDVSGRRLSGEVLHCDEHELMQLERTVHTCRPDIRPGRARCSQGEHTDSGERES